MVATGTLIRALTVIGIILLLLQAGQWARPAALIGQIQETKTFQYQVVEVTTEIGAMQRTLNEYGAAGWELVAVGLGDLTSPRLIFKR